MYGIDRPASVPLADQVAAIARMRSEVQATTDPREADAFRRGAHALRDALRAEPSGSVAVEILVEVADAYAWGCRRLGELYPAEQGARTDLPTSQGSPAKFPEPSRDLLLRCRQVASIPLEDFESALAEARAERRPITQTALLKLAPKNPARSRVTGVPETLLRTVRRCTTELRKLEGLAPKCDRPAVAAVAARVQALVDELATNGLANWFANMGAA